MQIQIPFALQCNSAERPLRMARSVCSGKAERQELISANTAQGKNSKNKPITGQGSNL